MNRGILPAVAVGFGGTARLKMIHPHGAADELSVLREPDPFLDAIFHGDFLIT
jgi:hypothetical protein